MEEWKGGKFITFTGGQIEEKVDNVGAVMAANRGAKLGSELWLEKGIGWNANWVSVNPTSPHTVVALNILRHSLHHHLRCPALVLFLFIFLHPRFQQTSLPRRCYRKRANIVGQIFANNFSCINLHER